MTRPFNDHVAFLFLDRELLRFLLSWFRKLLRLSVGREGAEHVRCRSEYEGKQVAGDFDCLFAIFQEAISLCGRQSLQPVQVAERLEGLHGLHDEVPRGNAKFILDFLTCCPR